MNTGLRLFAALSLLANYVVGDFGPVGTGYCEDPFADPGTMDSLDNTAIATILECGTALIDDFPTANGFDYAPATDTCKIRFSEDDDAATVTLPSGWTAGTTGSATSEEPPVGSGLDDGSDKVACYVKDPVYTQYASGSATLTGTTCATLNENYVKEALAAQIGYDPVSIVSLYCEDRGSSGSTSVSLSYYIPVTATMTTAALSVEPMLITQAEMSAALILAGMDSTVADSVAITRVFGVGSGSAGGANVFLSCTGTPLYPLIASGVVLDCAFRVTNNVQTTADQFLVRAGTTLPASHISNPMSATGADAGLLFPFTVLTPSSDFTLWGEYLDGTDFDQDKLSYQTYEQVGEDCTITCTAGSGLVNTVLAGETVTCTVVPRGTPGGPVVTTVVEQFVSAFVEQPSLSTNETITTFSGTSPGTEFTFTFTAPTAGATSKILLQTLTTSPPLLDIFTVGQVSAVSLTEGEYQPAGTTTTTATTLEFTPQNNICAGCKIHITLAGGLDYNPALGQPVVSTGGTWSASASTTSGVQTVVLTRSIGDEADVANTAVTVSFPKGSITTPSAGSTGTIEVTTYQANGVALDLVQSASVSGPTIVERITDLTATTSGCTVSGECDLTIAFVVPSGVTVRTGNELQYPIHGFELVDEVDRRRRLVSAPTTLTVVATTQYVAGDTISNTWRVQYQTTSSSEHNTLSVTVLDSSSITFTASAIAQIPEPELPFVSALVSDPYLWRKDLRKWEPFFPDTTAMLTLVDSPNMRVMAAFAQAEKSDCQCVWTHPDPTIPPTPGSRIVVAVLQLPNGLEIHVSLWGLFYKRDGAWITAESWPQLQAPPESSLKVAGAEVDDSDGVITSERVEVSWTAVGEKSAPAADADVVADLSPHAFTATGVSQRRFPWGTHEYSHMFKAQVGEDLVEIFIGNSDSVEVLDVYFHSLKPERAAGLLGNPAKAAFGASLKA